MNVITNLTVLQLERAVQIKKRIESLERELQELIAHSDNMMDQGNSRRGRISAAGRRRIAQAQRERWARFARRTSKNAVRTSKRQISAAGRARIAAAQRRRWAAVKAKA